MKRFIQGEHRGQSTLLPESLDDYVTDTNPVRVVDVFVDELDLVTSEKISSPSTAANSKLSTIVTAISPAPN